MSASPLGTHISDSVKKRYTIWVAQYNSKCTFKGDYGIWQYSSKGKVPGISGDTDMDYCYKDFPSIIKKGGFNGYAKGAANSVDDVAREVIDGKWGNGDARRRKLAAAGYDYATIQRRVNELLK